MEFIKKNYKMVIGVIVVYLFLASRNKALFFSSIGVMTLLVLVFFLEDIKILLAVVNISKNKPEGEKILLKMIAKNTKKYKPYLYIGNDKLKKGEYNEAISLLEKSLTLKVDIMGEKNITTTVACCYWKKGDIDKAIKYLVDLRKKYDYINSATLATLGFFYILKGDMDNAMEATEKAVLDNADNPQAYDNYGQIYFAKGDMENALLNYEKALELNPYGIDILYNIGEFYEKNGQAEKAYECYNKALECDFSVLAETSEKDIKSKLQQKVT